MKILVTGAAGFIGFQLARALLARGHAVVGLDSLNAYYSVSLKKARLAELIRNDRFSYVEMDLADAEALLSLRDRDEVELVIHLAAQAGVRHSIDHPFSYVGSNIAGHLSILEFCRHSALKPFLIYASSSSVYGNSTPAPFSEAARVDQPVSLYAATKRADELMSATYAHLYGLRQIGLRFFTVYGPWGRPDMAYWSFTERILHDEPIRVFNSGKLRRDFTHIDDVLAGLVSVVETEPDFGGLQSPHRIYNLGHNQPVELITFINKLEQAIGKPAKMEMLPMQPGDVLETCADISALKADYGYKPVVSLDDGLKGFVDWYLTVGQDLVPVQAR